MKGKLDPHHVGMALGALAGFWHLIWGVVVFLGFAEAFLTWIYGLHFLNNPFQVMAFDPIQTVLLVVVASVWGYVMGWVFATVWNQVGK